MSRAWPVFEVPFVWPPEELRIRAQVKTALTKLFFPSDSESGRIIIDDFFRKLNKTQCQSVSQAAVAFIKKHARHTCGKTQSGRGVAHAAIEEHHIELIQHLLQIQHPSLFYVDQASRLPAYYLFYLHGAGPTIFNMLLESPQYEFPPLLHAWLHDPMKSIPIDLLELYLCSFRAVPACVKEAAKRQTLGVKACSCLAKYSGNPQKKVERLRRKWKKQAYGPVLLFIHIILLADGYHSLMKNPPEELQKANRFFSIATKLPMELQMVLANRRHGLSANLIKSQMINTALRCLLADKVL